MTDGCVIFWSPDALLYILLYICYESDEGIKILRNSQRERLTSDSLFSTCNALRLFDGSFIFFPFDS